MFFQIFTKIVNKFNKKFKFSIIFQKNYVFCDFKSIFCKICQKFSKSCLFFLVFSVFWHIFMFRIYFHHILLKNSKKSMFNLEIEFFKKYKKRLQKITLPPVPERSRISVLRRPDRGWLRKSNGMRYFLSSMNVMKNMAKTYKI